MACRPQFPLAARFLIVMSLLASSLTWGQGYEPTRTAYGVPDLQGNWTNASITTLERNPRYESLTLSTDEVIRATESHPQNVRLETDDNLVPGELLDGSDLARGRGYNAFWIDPGTTFGNIDGEYRTSWIVDPADGRIPYSEQGSALRAALRQKNSGADGPESRPLAERCISTAMRVGPPMINGLYNNYYQIVQTADYVMIRTEMVSHARIIPLNSEHRMSVQAPMFGESVGYWDGDTLVIETTNFHPLQEETSISLSHDAKVQERLTRVSEDQIVYEFTVDDVAYYSRPWRGEVSFRKVPESVYEFACHEGNYALGGILAGERRAELEQELGR